VLTSPSPNNARKAADWEGFTAHYRHRETVNHIAVQRGQVGDDATSVTVDGIPQQGTTITLVDDHQEHAVEVRIRSKLGDCIVGG
jgi:cellobiose phosphorylase